MLGDEYPLAGPFLIKTGARVAAYPRLGNRSGPPFDLVDEGERIIGVDPCGGPSVLLAEPDVLAYKVEVRKLCRCLCKAFGFGAQDLWDSTGLGGIRNIGVFRPSATTRCVVFLVLSHDDGPQRDAIHRLMAQVREPLVLLTPQCIDDSNTQALLASHPALHLPLSETVAFSMQGQACAIAPADRLLNDFRQAVIARACASHVETAGRIPSAHADDQVAFAERVRRLKEMERNILVALSERHVIGIDAKNHPGQELLSRWAGYNCDASFKAALSGLVKMQLIDNGKHHGRRGGYFLTEDGKRAAEIVP